MRKINKFKEGAASFYIVAISTLILVIIAASFAAVIISEVTRTSNDDLAQSAYDSALAGIEDAKLAYYNYQNCVINKESASNCENIVNWIESGDESCDMVANILGRTKETLDSEELGVLVQETSVEETSVGNNMQQYYTCVTMTNKTRDVLGYVTETNPAYTVQVKLDDDRHAEDIQTVRVKWHLDKDGNRKEFKYEIFSSDDGIFGTQMVMPAVISVGMVQTSDTFKLSDFDVTRGDKTDRGTVYLVPTNDDNLSAVDGEYNTAWDGGKNINSIDKNGFLKSNDKTAKNLPYAVYCGDAGSDFACSAEIAIPEPVGGARSDKTFIFAVTLPYGGPSTHFSLEFCDDVACSTENIETGEKKDNRVMMKGVQVKIDSTGRANDLYRRVETRLQPGEVAYPYPLYAIQVLDKNGSNSLIDKNLAPISEWNFK